MKKQAKETVIVVHGTWSSKEKNEDKPPNWYAPGRDFCKQLDSELEKRGSDARCWAHLKSGEDYFHWDGKNDWLSRAKTAARLRKEIRRLRREEGWTVHLVGHSHGGNVILDAVTDDERSTQPWFDGRAVLFGTPVYNNSWDLTKRRRMRRVAWVTLSLFVWLGLAFYSTRDFNLLAAFTAGTSTEYVAGLVALPLLFSIAFHVLIAFGVLQPETKTMRYRRSPGFLTIGSQYDEVYRSLSGLKESANPFLDAERPEIRAGETLGAADRLRRITHGMVSPLARLLTAVAQVVDSLRSSLSVRIKQTLRLRTLLPTSLLALFLVLTALYWRPFVSATGSEPLGAPALSLGFLSIVTTIFVASCFYRRSFAGAALLPGFIASNALPATFRAVRGVAFASLDTVVKNAAWGLVKSLSLGMNGAPRRVEDIDVSLSVGGDHLHLDLPESIVSDVLERQKPQLDAIQKLLYQHGVKWSPEALREQLEETGFPMIHTIYYRHSDCIQKTADWIAEPMIEEYDGYTIHDTNQGPLEGPNGYKNHLGRLKLRISSPGSIWREPLSEAEERFAAMSVGLPFEHWVKNKDKILTLDYERSLPPVRMPPPPKEY